MHLTDREWWTLVHGMILGALFLLAFSGGLAGLYSLRPDYLTAEGLRERTRRLKIGISAMAIVAWLTVITGTWIVYPWYREKLAGEDLSGCEGVGVPTDECSPRDFLLSNVSGNTEDWHKFGMEWKDDRGVPHPVLRGVAREESVRPTRRHSDLRRRLRDGGHSRTVRRSDHESSPSLIEEMR
jgi:hypothetical protein